MGTVNYQAILADQRKITDGKIIQEMVAEESFSSVTGPEVDEIMTICNKVPKGAKQDSCFDQLDQTRSSGFDMKTTMDYWKAVGKGYSGSIKDFSDKKNKYKKALALGQSAASALSGLVVKDSNQDVKSPGLFSSEPTSSPKRFSAMQKAGIIALSLSVIGIATYFIVKNR